MKANLLKLKADFKAAQEFVIPQDYIFPYQPNMMQKRVAIELSNSNYLLNYSGMGAGKTVSALLTSRHIKSKLTVIVCPNQTIDTWTKQLSQIFRSYDVEKKTFKPQFLNNSPYKYVVLNFDMFQQSHSDQDIVDFVKANNVEMLIIDEVHFAKQRDKKKMSIRRKNLLSFRTLLQNKNNNLKVLTMSGTPVINNLQESKSLIELTTGQLEDLGISNTIPNIMKHHQRLETIGVRFVPTLPTTLNISKVKCDATSYLDDVKKALKEKQILELEKALTQAKLPYIIENLVKGQKTIIYSHYINGENEKVKDILFEGLTKAGFSVAFWDGEDDNGKFEFKQGADVLLASSAISTGVDGLQDICNKMIINILPWTNAEYNQLIARIYRQGQNENVEIIVMDAFINLNNETWSYDQYKWELIEFKGTLADAVINGSIPEGNIISKDKALQYLKDWLKRIEENGVNDIEKPMIEPFIIEEEKLEEFEEPKEKIKPQRPINVWHKTQHSWAVSNSSTIAEKYKENPNEWRNYHSSRNEFVKTWDSNPNKVLVDWCLNNDDKLTVADFGCGMANIYKMIGNKHTVYSFDFVAVDENVTACDMSNTPLEDKSLDAALFCLSLITLDCKKAIYEAHRTLKRNKFLHIIEPASKIQDVSLFVDSIENVGFTFMKVNDVGSNPQFKHFIFIKDKELDDKIDIVWE